MYLDYISFLIENMNNLNLLSKTIIQKKIIACSHLKLLNLNDEVLKMFFAKKGDDGYRFLYKVFYLYDSNF